MKQWHEDVVVIAVSVVAFFGAYHYTTPMDGLLLAPIMAKLVRLSVVWGAAIFAAIATQMAIDLFTRKKRRKV